MRTRTLVALLVSLTAPVGLIEPLAAQKKGVTLSELTELAKARAEKLRPELEKKLETSKAAYRAGIDAARETVADGAEDDEDAEAEA